MSAKTTVMSSTRDMGRCSALKDSLAGKAADVTGAAGHQLFSINQHCLPLCGQDNPTEHSCI